MGQAPRDLPLTALTAGFPQNSEGFCQALRSRRLRRLLSSFSDSAAHCKTNPAMVRRIGRCLDHVSGVLPGDAAGWIRVGSLACEITRRKAARAAHCFACAESPVV